MDYNHIDSFLERFKKILFKEEATLEVITGVITKHIESPIKPQSIKIKGPIVYINESPILRNEVLIHKEGILNDLKEFLPRHRFSDIR
ncbi:MAG: hypothetical protein AAB477_00315 [Patescibacteria group bacterium]